MTSTSQTTGWLVNNEPYRINSLCNGILTGYSATLGGGNLIVENIMMNDVRNGSEYICVIIPGQNFHCFAPKSVIYVAITTSLVVRQSSHKMQQVHVRTYIYANTIYSEYHCIILILTSNIQDC